MTTLTSREFNRDVSAAKRAAEAGPVIITDRGRPAHVLMSIEDFQRLEERAGRLADRLFDPASASVELGLDDRRIDERPSEP